MNAVIEGTDSQRQRAGVQPPVLASLAGALGGGVLGMLFAIGNDSDNLFLAFALGAVFGLILAALVVAEVVDNRLYRIQRTVPIFADDVQVHAARWFGGPHGHSAASSPANWSTGANLSQGY